MKNVTEAEIIQRMLGDQRLRRIITKRSFYMFFRVYFAEHMEYPAASFQREMMALAQNKDVQNLVVAGFRNSAKSTILSLAFVIWTVLGEHKIKHVLIASKTQPKAQMLLQHIKDALGPDTLLKKDMGPFKEFSSPWNLSSIVLKNYKARITTTSTEQSVRGIRHGRHRPQLIVLDDIEDIESVKTQDGRDKLYEWLVREVIPAGDLSTRLILVGNKLHDDSVMMRLQRAIESGAMGGVYRNYPALDENGIPLWPGKYRDKAVVEAEMLRGMPELAYRREMLLEIIPEGYGIIKRESLRFYDFGASFPGYRFSIIAIDPAAKTGPKNDCTAIVSADVYGSNRDMKIRVRPNPINARLSHEELIDRTVHLAQTVGGGHQPRIFIEAVGFQEVFIIPFRNLGLTVEPAPLHGKSKEDRLNASAFYVENGTVEFAKVGNEELITQVLYFGSDDHDDLVDALSLLILKTVEIVGKEPSFLQYAHERTASFGVQNPMSFMFPRGMADWVMAARRGRV